MYDESLDEDKLDKMREYGALEGTEVGETWCLLADLFEHLQPDYVSEEFIEAVKKEVKKHSDNIEDNWEVEVSEELRKVIHRELIQRRTTPLITIPNSSEREIEEESDKIKARVRERAKKRRNI